MSEVADGPAFQSILRLCTRQFDALTPAEGWHVEAHQFRIEAQPGQAGQLVRPTQPLRLHRLQLAVRDRVDPDRLFTNAYLERVLGP